jgi:hypothetical protein
MSRKLLAACSIALLAGCGPYDGGHAKFRSVTVVDGQGRAVIKLQAEDGDGALTFVDGASGEARLLVGEVDGKASVTVKDGEGRSKTVMAEDAHE